MVDIEKTFKLDMPKQIKGISHPAIKNMYKKKKYSSNDVQEDVIIIETREKTNEEIDMLLEDLDLLQLQIFENSGHFDRMEIRK